MPLHVHVLPAADEQLQAVMTCVALVEQRQREAEGSEGSGGSGEEDGDDDAEGSDGSCAWMRPKVAPGSGKAKPVPDLHRLYYAAHRGLHARK